MKSFLKYTLATILGIFVSAFLFFIVFSIVLSTALSTKEKPVKVKSNSFLHVKLNYNIPDRKPQNPFENFDFTTFQPIKQLGLNEILDNIEKAKNDSRIKGIYLDIGFISASYATLEEIRNALIDFKSAGKFIMAYGNFYTQKGYYLTSVADEIYMNPEGMISLTGLTKQVVFFKGTFDKLGINPEVVRQGEYKSFVEPYTQKEMSEANKEQSAMLINTMWEHTAQGIAAKRNITFEDINTITDGLLTIEHPENSVTYKLIDSLQYKDQIIEKLKHKMNVEKEKALNPVSMFDYAKVPASKPYKGVARKKVAVIFASGQIGMGNQQSSDGVIDANSLSKTIRNARKDSSIKAIVLRVNSPGGSALASEVIWREIDLSARVKPVIASMGGVAASGGYYILSAADSIIASPNTITGSIGVFGLLLNAKDFMNDKLGITSDLVKTNEKADLGNIFRAMTPSEKAVLQNSVEHVYETFIQRVAEGRNMTKEAVDEIGQGRVWSGIDAKEIGLIDEFGGFREAIAMAVEKAKIEKYRVVYLPRQKKPIELIMEEFRSDIKTSILKNELGTDYQYYQDLKNLLRTQGIQARLPYEFIIE